MSADLVKLSSLVELGTSCHLELPMKSISGEMIVRYSCLGIMVTKVS